MQTLKKPSFGKNVFIAQGAVIRGSVTISHESSVWFNAVIRAESGSITIGKRTNIQDNCVLHIDPGKTLTLGNEVTVGHGAILHGCTIYDNTLIGMGAIVLNDAVIGKNCIVGAGSLVTQGTIIPDGSLVVGSPAKVKRTLSTEEIADIKKNAAFYVQEAALYSGESSSTPQNQTTTTDSIPANPRTVPDHSSDL